MSIFSRPIVKFAFISIFCSVLLAPLSNAQIKDRLPIKTFVVIGTGKIYKNNTAGARKKAIENSLISAAEKASVSLLPPESLARNFQAFNEVFYVQLSEFIQDYRVLAEYQSQKTYRVMVEANISVAELKKIMSDAGIMLGKKSLPKILVLISEKNFKDLSPRYWWGQKTDLKKAYSLTSLVNTLKNEGFSVVDDLRKPQDTGIDYLFDKPDLNNSEAIKIGFGFQADVVVVGQSIVDRTPNIMGNNIRSFQGTLSARAIRTDTGEEIASTTQSTVTANANESEGSRNAFSSIGSLAGKNLAPQIIDAWQKEEEQANMIQIFVSGTNNLSDFETFKSIINNMPEVTNLQTKEMTADEAVISVEFQGSAKSLADALILKTFKSIGINIYEVSQDHLRIELIPG